MKIAVYADLPSGGALNHTLEAIKKFRQGNKVTIFAPKLTPVNNRLARDLQSIVWAKFDAWRIAQDINKSYDLAYVTHDRFFQAPWILRFLKVPTIFYCQEPTRAFFEPELGIVESWPLLNKLYETLIRKLKKGIEIKNASYAKDVRVNSIYSQGVIKRVYGLGSQVEYPTIDKKVFRKLKIKKKNQIIWVGNDEPQKRLKLAIESLALVKDAPTLVIVSPRSPVTSDTVSYAAKLGVKMVSKVGISQSELVKAYNQSIVTLATALREPFGYTPHESLACGTPVIAVNEGAFPETLKGKSHVVIVNAQAQEISQAISIFI